MGIFNRGGQIRTGDFLLPNKETGSQDLVSPTLIGVIFTIQSITDWEPNGNRLGTNSQPDQKYVKSTYGCHWQSAEPERRSIHIGGPSIVTRSFEAGGFEPPQGKNTNPYGTVTRTLQNQYNSLQKQTLAKTSKMPFSTKP